jgi:hypothetical protein
MTPGFIYFYSTAGLVERGFNRFHLAAWWSWVHLRWFDYRADRVMTTTSNHRIPDTVVNMLKVNI